MVNYVITFTDIYQKLLSGRIKVLGTAKVGVPVRGFFLRRRRNEIIEKVWHEVRLQYGVNGYKSVTIEERELTFEELHSGTVSYR